MAAGNFAQFVFKLATDPAFRDQYEADHMATMEEAGLTDAQKHAITTLDEQEIATQLEQESDTVFGTGGPDMAVGTGAFRLRITPKDSE